MLAGKVTNNTDIFFLSLLSVVPRYQVTLHLAITNAVSYNNPATDPTFTKVIMSGFAETALRNVRSFIHSFVLGPVVCVAVEYQFLIVIKLH